MSNAEQAPEDGEDGLTTFSVGMSKRGHLTVRAYTTGDAVAVAEQHAIDDDFGGPEVDPGDVTEDPGAEPEVDPQGRLYANENVPIPSVPLPSTLGNELREVRKSLGLSIRDVAREAGISHTSVSRVEKGKTQNLNLFRAYSTAVETLRSEGGRPDGDGDE